jgi:phenylacetate-CoA ligase
MQPLHRRYLETIRKTQWLAPDKLLHYQARLLEDIARHAYETVPFYRERLAPLFPHGEFDLRGWRDVPVVSRTDVMGNEEALAALAVPRGAARETDGSTSGTTGLSLKFRQSELAGIATVCMNERTLEAHSIDRTAHLARIHGEPAGVAEYPEGIERRGWSLSYPDARESALTIHASVAEQTEWLERLAPKYLATYQSTATALARQLETDGRSLALGAVFTSGETVDAPARDDIRRVFHCEIIDRYAALEIGSIAFQCPAGAGYHTCAEAVLVELLDDDGNDVVGEARGRVVLTSYYNFAMPFIRYDIGDLAVAAQGPCPCGRTLPRLAAVLGRQRNVFTFSDGSQYAPYYWRPMFCAEIDAKQLQIVQTAVDAIEVRYVPHEGTKIPDPAKLEEIGRKKIHPTVMVRAVPVAEIARDPSGKIHDCISLVQPHAAKAQNQSA